MSNIIKIGSAKIKTKILLAPLSGCSDLAFRLIAREHGAQFCFFEMIDSHSVLYGPRWKMSAILNTCGADRPIAAQILGNDPEITLRAAEKITAHADIEFLDLNAACPAKKVIKKGAGAHLLQDKTRLCKILRTLSRKLDIPVTVKLRIGYNERDPKAIAMLAKKCEDAGASALFVHGRTRVQGYKGDIDYESIRIIKESVKIPVFGSGNIFSPQSAIEMLARTGCDGILVARGALGNPWIFGEIENYLAGNSRQIKINAAAKKKVLKRHLSYIEKYKECSSEGKVGFMRKVVLWYIKGFPQAAKARREICVVNAYEKMIELIDKTFRERI